MINSRLDLFPYDKAGSKLKKDEKFRKIELNQPIKFFHKEYNNLYVSL